MAAAPPSTLGRFAGRSYSSPSGNWIGPWRALWGLIDRNILIAKRSSAKRFSRCCVSCSPNVVFSTLVPLNVLLMGIQKSYSFFVHNGARK